MKLWVLSAVVIGTLAVVGANWGLPWLDQCLASGEFPVQCIFVKTGQFQPDSF